MSRRMILPSKRAEGSYPNPQIHPSYLNPKGREEAQPEGKAM